MPATKISDLLPIPDGAKTPHAYQVFGLEGGEQDSAKIKAAVSQVYQRLKAAKTETDPDLWRTAAKLVEKSRGILTDPKKRAELDARFGVIQFDEAIEPTATLTSDPLAGVLPSNDPLSSNPLGVAVPAGDPLAVATPMSPTAGMAPVGIAPMAPNPMVPPVPQTVETTVQPATQPAQPAPKAAIKHPVVNAKKTSRRRRKSWAGTAMFGIFLLGMFAIIGLLLHFLVLGPGHLSITSKDGQIAISTKPQEQQLGVEDTQSRPVNRDPVMGNVPTSGRVRPGGSLASANPITNPSEMLADPMTDATPPMQEPVEASPTETPVAQTPIPVDTPKPGPVPTPEMTPITTGSKVLPVQSGEQESAATEMSDQMMAAADKAIANVEKVIQQANWDQMKPAAEKLTEMTLTKQQRAYADTLFHLADLATFYRGGIVRGIGTLKAASTFEYVEGVTVLVVETSADGLTIRRSARNRSFTLDDMPFKLAERLCSFALSPDKPDNIAARSCFQAIAPQSNAEYRKDAISWLEFVNDDVEAVDTKEVAKAIKKLFPD